MRKYLGDTSRLLWTDDLILRYISEADKDICDNVQLVWKRFPLNIVNGTFTYDISSGVVGTLGQLKNITRISWMGYTVDALTQDQVAMLSPVYMTQQSRPRWFTLQFEGYTTLRLYPGPSTSLPPLSDYVSILTDVNIQNECVVSGFFSPEEEIPYVFTPDFVARRTIKAYVLWKCYAREGNAQNLKLAQYYKTKYEKALLRLEDTYGKTFNSTKRQYTDVAIQRPWKPHPPILPPQFGTNVDYW